MRNIIMRPYFILLVIIGLAYLNCSIGQGIEAQTIVPKIKGRVYFEGEKPENTEWVVVVASREFPPTDIVELAQTQSNYLNLSADSADYEISLPALGTFAAVGAVWKGKKEDLALSDVLGIFGASISGGISFPDSVAVTADEPIAENVNFVADFSRVNRGAMLRGTIHYLTPWPANTEFMGIAAFKRRPQNILEFLDVAAINLSLPFNVEEFDYKLAVPPGTYAYVVVLWKGKGTSLIEFKEVGFYETEPFSGLPGSVTLAKGDTLRGIDINVDFR